MPAFFGDLNLDQIIDAVTAGKEEYNLKPLFYTPLNDIATIEYRHEIMRDLENNTVVERISSFAQKMRTMRSHLALANELRYKYQKERWFFDAVEIYCSAVDSLTHDLTSARLTSHGLLALRDYLTSYTSSIRFTSLSAETEKLKADLSAIRYSVLIKGNGFKVCKYESEIDYSAEVEEIFEKFKQGAVKDYRVQFADPPDMNYVEEKVLGFVAQLYSDIFSRLENYCNNNDTYLDETIRVVDRELQFYIAYLDYIATLKQEGLKFCYPKISGTNKAVSVDEGFDLALAYKLTEENSPVVCNDFYLKNNERIFVVSGPNQGGKTTFARTFGQLHYLASLGCPVPGREAQLFLFDLLFTHFEKEEHIETLRGKLENDLVRIHAILDQATPNSIIIMNEIFTSTTLKDAIFLSKQILKKIMHLDVLCVCVTFIDELASLSKKTVSMVSSVVPENPAQRTFKVVRKPADGLAYARSIAEKYRITYDYLRERIKS
ncbi:MAG TPA: DNA mismatch repair protein MutS [Bacteroidota bacterium]|nr:DNA mismatch repair protein MutS [Bacteroidota bacterium]